MDKNTIVSYVHTVCKSYQVWLNCNCVCFDWILGIIARVRWQSHDNCARKLTLASNNASQTLPAIKLCFPRRLGCQILPENARKLVEVNMTFFVAENCRFTKYMRCYLIFFCKSPLIALIMLSCSQIVRPSRTGLVLVYVLKRPQLYFLPIPLHACFFAVILKSSGYILYVYNIALYYYSLLSVICLVSIRHSRL